MIIIIIFTDNGYNYDDLCYYYYGFLFLDEEDGVDLDDLVGEGVGGRFFFLQVAINIFNLLPETLRDM